MNTDAWKFLISNTAFISFERKLKTDISTQLWYKKNTENEKTLNIEKDTKKLLWDLWLIESKFNKKFKDFLDNNKGLRQKDYLTWQKVVCNDFPNQLKTDISKKIKLYSKKIWEDLIKNNAKIIKNWWTFNLPLWNWKNVKLDFSKLWNIDNLSNSKKLELYNSNFDSIYRNDLWEQIYDTILDTWETVKENPWKTAIHITGMIFAWTWAVLASQWSWGITAPLIAWPTFTVLDNLYKAWMYELFDIEGWWKAWLSIEENDKHNDILRKKLFELFWNTVLFWMFRFTWLLEKKYLWQVDSQFKSMVFKTPIEAWFLTYYAVVSENLQDTIKNDWNINEILNDFSEISNFDDLIKLYIYNLWFITAVKFWSIPAEKIIITKYQKQLNNEMKRLQDKWFLMMETWSWYAFFKWLNRVDNIWLKSFERFKKLNIKMNNMILEQYKKPECWKWNPAYNSTTFREQKFQKLKEYSKKAQSWELGYALHDKTMFKILKDNWIWKEWENIWEWLLEKSLFRKWEKLEPKNKSEKEAVKEMEKANMIIYREYKNWMKKVSKWKSIREAFSNLSNELIQRLKSIVKEKIYVKPIKE
jgi:hypothetical protein